MKAVKECWACVFRNRARSSRTALRIATFVTLLSVWCVAAIPVHGQITPDKQQVSSIRGLVINSVTRGPIGRALVISPDNHFAVMTDSEGHFEFTFAPTENQDSADSGSPTPQPERPTMLTARKPGFLTDQDSTQNVQSLPPGKEVTIQLTPEALVIGRIVLPTSDAPDRIQVEIYRRQVREGRASWDQAGSTTTRSSGEFRFADLQPGMYKLLTRELLDVDPLIFIPGGQLYGYRPVYFAHATDFAAAETILVQGGEIFQANIHLVRRAYYPVKVPVANALPGGGVAVVVSVQGRKGPGFDLRYSAQDQMIKGELPDGNYTIDASSFAPGATGSVNISINGAALEGPRLTLLPDASIEVKVTEEFTSKEEVQPGATTTVVGRNVGGGPRSYVNVYLERADEFGQGRGAGLRPPASPEDDSLIIDNVPPGRYWVRVPSSPRYAASISSGTTDLLHQPLVVGVGASSPPIEITMRDDGAEIDGTVIASGSSLGAKESTGTPNGVDGPGPVVGAAYVYCIPQPDSTGEFREIWVSPNGTFATQTVPPGVYRFLAFDRQKPDLEYRNPESMRAYDTQGQVVRLSAGQKEHLRLQVISKGE